MSFKGVIEARCPRGCESFETEIWSFIHGRRSPELRETAQAGELNLLLCPGELDDHQWQAMRRHPLLSVRIMEGMEFLEQEIPAVRYHHERFDGKGYPEGISGASIPLTARILAVAEAFVGMTSPRSFRAPKPLAQALAELRSAAGTQFDPAVVEAFQAIAHRGGDELFDVVPEPASHAAGENLTALALAAHP